MRSDIFRHLTKNLKRKLAEKTFLEKYNCRIFFDPPTSLLQYNSIINDKSAECILPYCSK